MKVGCRYILLWLLPLLLSFALSITSCNPHEFPPVPEGRVFTLKLHYDSDFIKWQHQYNEGDMLEVGNDGPDQDVLSGARARYIIRAYPSNDTKTRAQSANQNFIKEFVFARDIRDSYDCSFALCLPPGEYSLMVWSDFVQSKNDQFFYNVSDFSELKLQLEDIGSTRYKDAFRGTCDVVLPKDILAHDDISVDAEMQRPLAKYEFIATDLAKFISNEQARAAEKQKNSIEGESHAINSDVSLNSIDFDKYKAVFYYVGYMPCAYSMFSDKPVDSNTGVVFETKLNGLNEAEASVGFDYVLVNGTQSAVTLQIAIFDEDNTRLSLTEPIEVPLKRSRHTIVRGDFLTLKASGGVKVNPDYEGDHNVIIP